MAASLVSFSSFFAATDALITPLHPHRGRTIAATYEEAMARLGESLSARHQAYREERRRVALAKSGRQLVGAGGVDAVESPPGPLGIALDDIGRYIEEAVMGPPLAARFHANGLAKAAYWGGRYVNSWDPYCCDHGPLEGLAMAMEGGLPRFNETVTAEEKALLLPPEPVDWAALEAARAPGAAPGVNARWVGHATVLGVVDGLTFITDPVLGEKCSPVDFGPSRYVPAPFEVEDMPFDLDVVLISHNHFDHLCPNTMARILSAHRGDAAPLLLVPMGVGATCEAFGVPRERIVELDWWETVLLHRGDDGVVSYRKPSGIAPEAKAYGSERPAGTSSAPAQESRVIFTPAQHWSARTPLDRNATLWGSFVVEGRRAADQVAPPSRFYFAGDTGYCPVFQQIGDVFGPFDVAALPLGAYAPKWFMAGQHADPTQALTMHKELKAAVSFGIHWGTWPLAQDGPLDPLVELSEVLEDDDGDHTPFLALKAGGGVSARRGEVRSTDGAINLEAATDVAASYCR